MAEVECVVVKSDSFGRLHASPFRIDVGFIVHAYMHQ